MCFLFWRFTTWLTYLLARPWPRPFERKNKKLAKKYELSLRPLVHEHGVDSTNTFELNLRILWNVSLFFYIYFLVFFQMFWNDRRRLGASSFITRILQRETWNTSWSANNSDRPVSPFHFLNSSKLLKQNQNEHRLYVVTLLVRFQATLTAVRSVSKVSVYTQRHFQSFRFDQPHRLITSGSKVQTLPEYVR